MSQFIPPPMPPRPPPPPQDTPKKRTPMRLRWPAVFPLIVFVAVQVFYGWPDAKVRASGQDYAISYLMGGIMGGVLASYVLAWITCLSTSNFFLQKFHQGTEFLTKTLRYLILTSPGMQIEFLNFRPNLRHAPFGTSSPWQYWHIDVS